jgi:hypothetical protein
MKRKDYLHSGMTVRVIRSHHNLNDDCVGKIGTIENTVLENSIFRVRIEGRFFLFGGRDLKVITTYEMLSWGVEERWT